MAWLEQIPNMFPLAHSLTSANMNGIRDSLLELFAAKATAAGQIAYADAVENIDMLNILNNGLLRAGTSAPEWEAVLTSGSLTANTDDARVPRVGAIRQAFQSLNGFFVEIDDGTGR